MNSGHLLRGTAGLLLVLGLSLAGCASSPVKSTQATPAAPQTVSTPKAQHRALVSGAPASGAIAKNVKPDGYVHWRVPGVAPQPLYLARPAGASDANPSGTGLYRLRIRGSQLQPIKINEVCTCK